MTLLTIIIPTYNRANFLKPLLGSLVSDISNLGSKVKILIGDNASSDNTEQICNKARDASSAIDVIRHKSNLGPDENFALCLEKVSSRYFWILGDDDLPLKNVIENLVRVLEQHLPDMVYLQNDWQADIYSVPRGSSAMAEVEQMDKFNFAKKLNVWFTFISGMVINMDTFKMSGGAIRRYSGTHLIQLGWTFDVLNYGKSFLFVNDICVRATSGNSGNYAVIKVFGANFPDIVQNSLGVNTPMTNAILRRHILGYLSSLIWQLRFGNIGAFHKSFPINLVKEKLYPYFYFWVFVVPLMTWPKFAAWPLLVLAKCFAYLTKRIF